MFNHWTDPDREIKFTNFLAAFYPFAVSVFIAFIPDLERTKGMRRAWRIGIIAGGLLYSLILWHQQSVNLTASRHDQQQIVATAVNNSNEHSDQHSDTQIAGVKRDLAGVSKHSDQQIDSIRTDLKGSMVAVTGLISKTTGDLNSAIAKVGKPDPPERARLRFSLRGDGNVDVAKSPLVAYALKPDTAGVFSVDFTFQNVSQATASKIDFWISICTDCIYSAEPSNFEKPSGMNEHMRHRFLPGILNPGVTIETTTILVKPIKPLPWFDIAFKYSCETCGSISDPQTARILALNEWHGPIVRPTPIK